MASLRSSPPAFDSAFPIKLFEDLPEIWDSSWKSEDFSNIFEILKLHGTFEEALSLMIRIHQQSNLEHTLPDSNCWSQVLEGLAINSSHHADLKAVEAWNHMKQFGTTPVLSTFCSLFKVLAPFERSFDIILQIYRNEFLASNCQPDGTIFRYVLKAHMNQLPSAAVINSGNQIYEQLLRHVSVLSRNPEFWDCTTQWMLFRGEPLRLIKSRLYGQDEALDHESPTSVLSNTPVESSPALAAPSLHPNEISLTLNHLMNLALRLNKIAIANEIYDEIFPAMGLSPTSATDELRLQALLQAHDARAAKSLYDDLRLEGYKFSSDVIVRLIRELCQNDNPQPIEAQAVFFDLLDTREAPSEALSASFSMLTSFLLAAGDYPRLRQTLQDQNIDRVPNWRNVLSTIVLDRLSDPKTIWLEQLLPIYHIAQRWASDLITLSHRHNLLHKLISHGRTDLGLELFHDMRHSDISQPTSETYLILLAGCAKTRDARTLEHVHNALRLDSSVEPDTDMFNALILAYNQSRLPEKALAIWEVLSQSAKLPDVETASLALAACVSLPRYGLIRAREIWTFMEENDIRPTSSSYAALLSVFASVGKWDGMIGLLERMDREQVNAMVLGTAYNEMRRDRKPEVESWARANRPETWQYLENLSQRDLDPWRRT